MTSTWRHSNFSLGFCLLKLFEFLQFVIKWLKITEDTFCIRSISHEDHIVDFNQWLSIGSFPEFSLVNSTYTSHDFITWRNLVGLVHGKSRNNSQSCIKSQIEIMSSFFFSFSILMNSRPIKFVREKWMNQSTKSTAISPRWRIIGHIHAVSA